MERADSLHEFPRDHLQRLVSEHLDGAVVHFQCVVESNLIFGKAKFCSASCFFTDVLGKSDEFFDDLGCLDCTVLILAYIAFY